MGKTDEAKTYLRGFLPRAVFTKMKCLRWYRHNDTGRLNEWCCEMAERITGRAFAAWGEVAAEIDGMVENDIKAIREAA